MSKHLIEQSRKYILTATLLAFLFFKWQNIAIATSSNIPQFVAPAIAYHPRGMAPGTQESLFIQDQIIRDLRLLRTNGFRSLVSYTARGLQGNIPQIARQEGFDGTIIMGIWDPFSEEELKNAIGQAKYVDGYCIGNEGLGIRYTPDELSSKMSELRRLTGRPVTTTEPIDSYLNGPFKQWLQSNSDWLFPLAQPVWANRSDPIEAVNWILARYDYLTATTGRRVILKEAGLPSQGSDLHNEARQLAFFKAIESTDISFFYFEAFDQPWKRDHDGQPGFEVHWGLYRADGRPKKIISWLTKQWLRQ